MQQLEQEVGQKSSEITSKEDEIVKARLEITRSLREVEDLKKKMLIAEKSREDLQVRLGRMLFTFDLENIKINYFNLIEPIYTYYESEKQALQEKIITY